MSVDLLRHGATLGGARYCGSTDVLLSEQGWEQMRRAVAGRRWDVMVSSPLQRCAAFAQQLAAEQGVSCVLEPNLREMSFGAWEGLTADEIMRRDGEALRLFWSDPQAQTPPGGEALAQLHERVITAWHRIAEYAGSSHVLVVTHGGPIRVLKALCEQVLPAAMMQIAVPHAALVAVDVPALDAALLRRIERASTGSPQ